MSATASLKNKAAIVTGAAQGIGRACAERLARDGAHVLLSDINGDKAAGVAKAIVASGGRAESMVCDVSKPEAVAAMLAAPSKPSAASTLPSATQASSTAPISLISMSLNSIVCSASTCVARFWWRRARRGRWWPK